MQKDRSFPVRRCRGTLCAETECTTSRRRKTHPGSGSVPSLTAARLSSAAELRELRNGQRHQTSVLGGEKPHPPILSNATRLRGRQTWGVNDWINTESQPPGREAAECAGPRPLPAGGGAFLTYAAADGNNSRQLTPFFFFFFLPRWRLADSDLNPGGLWPRPGTRPRWSRNCTCP